MVAVKASTTAQTSSAGTSLAIAWASTIANHVVFLAAASDVAGATFGVPTGFTLIRNLTAVNDNLYFWYKVLTGSESGTVTLTAGASANLNAIMVEVIDVDTTTPTNGSSIASSGGTAPGGVTPTLTSLQDSMLLHFECDDQSVGVQGMTASSGTGLIAQVSQTVGTFLHLSASVRPECSTTMTPTLLTLTNSGTHIVKGAVAVTAKIGAATDDGFTYANDICPRPLVDTSANVALASPPTTGQLWPRPTR